MTSQTGRWPWFNARTGQAWYIWCKNLAFNIEECVTRISWHVSVPSQFGT